MRFSNSYFRYTFEKTYRKREQLGACKKHAPNSHGTRYGTMPCTFIEHQLFHSYPKSQRRCSPPDLIGDMKLSGQTVSTIHLRGSSGSITLPAPFVSLITPRSSTILAVCRSLYKI